MPNLIYNWKGNTYECFLFDGSYVLYITLKQAGEFL